MSYKQSENSRVFFHWDQIWDSITILHPYVENWFGSFPNWGYPWVIHAIDGSISNLKLINMFVFKKILWRFVFRLVILQKMVALLDWIIEILFEFIEGIIPRSFFLYLRLFSILQFFYEMGVEAQLKDRITTDSILE